jgi:sialate O-acetylesterase
MKRISGIVLTAALFLLLHCVVATANVKLPAVVGDHMVMQQNTTVAIWGWAEPGEKISVTPSWQQPDAGSSATAQQDGSWMSLLKTPKATGTPKAAGPFTIKIESNNKIVLEDILIGEVWLCSGQSNMVWPLANCDNSETELATADFPYIRLFYIDRDISRIPKNNCNGVWKQCTPENASDFSAVAFFFGRKLHKSLNVPVGLICSCWNGTTAEAWMPNDALLSSPDFAGILQPMKPSKPQRFHENSPSALYNAMIAPLVPYGIRGVIWYQGESNCSQAHLYRTLFPALIESWRNSWNSGDFPFYYVQIAPYHYNAPLAAAAAQLRESQLKSMSTPNTGMAVTTDIGDVNDIHPTNKQDVGKRLALWALAQTYGKNGIVYSGPLYRAMRLEGNRIRLMFDYVGSGLMVRGGPLSCFTIAGRDRRFVVATARIDGDTILVSSEAVPRPVAVRFAWSNAPEPNLFNREGLPASPFRTDDWPSKTRIKQ